jgi:ribonucleoside-diphosphate reductase beta chain
MQIFTDPWARAWGERLNESEAYREAAENWEGAVLLEDSLAVDGLRAVFLDLRHGACLEARAARAGDGERARYVLTATEADWLRVLDGMSPISAILRGKLKLSKGSLASLMPFTRAASELVEAARRIEPDVRPADPATDPPVPAPAPQDGARRFLTTSPERLDLESFPMQLFEKAKTFGVWNPSEIDFSQDVVDWAGLEPMERDILLRLTSLFQAGEESVALDLLPLIRVIAGEGRLEEEIYLTSFLWEEAKHVEVFARFFEAIGESESDLSGYHTPSYRKIFYEELPSSMTALETDASPAAQARASVTYNLIVEGVLAETGYHMYHRVLVEHGILPGMQRVTDLLKQDESRHLAYGVHLLSRLVREHGDPLWSAIETRMDELLEPAIGIIHEAFGAYDPNAIPFGLSQDHFVEFAQTQFEKRLGHVERSRDAGGG